VPSEVRKILFSWDEVKAAAVDFCRAGGRDVPDATVAHVGISEAPRAAVSLHFQRSSSVSGPSAKLTLDIDDVKVALVRFCATRGIPIPRAGRKSLCPHGDGIAMVITLGAAARNTRSASLPSRAVASSVF
jgi:hypothetical protein